MIVDAHTHLLPEGLARAIRAFFDRHIADGIDYPYLCDGVLVAVQAAGAERCWSLPYVRRPDAAAELNRWMAETFADRDDVVPGATVHPGDDVGEVVAEACDALGARLFKLHCSVGDFAADDARLDPLWSAVSQSGQPVVVHAGHATDGTTAAAEIEPIARVAERWPDARIVVAHCGAPAVAETLALVRRSRSVYADLAPVVTDLVPLVREDLAGIERRILFGSDAPNVCVPIEAGIARVRALGLTPEDEAAVLGGTAEALTLS